MHLTKTNKNSIDDQQKGKSKTFAVNAVDLRGGGESGTQKEWNMETCVIYFGPKLEQFFFLGGGGGVAKISAILK